MLGEVPVAALHPSIRRQTGPTVWGTEAAGMRATPHHVGKSSCPEPDQLMNSPGHAVPCASPPQPVAARVIFVRAACRSLPVSSACRYTCACQRVLYIE